LNAGGAELGWNDLYTMTRRPKSYQGYAQIHRQMTNDRRAGNKRAEIVDGPFISRFFPMRKAGRKNDPTLHDLKLVRCRSDLGPTQVHVSMFYWKGVRGNYLTDHLFKLARRGCKVSVIIGAPSRDMATRLRDAARRNLIELHDSRWDFNGDGAIDIRTHAKYVLVKGGYGADRAAYRVLTGSQNWVAGSLSKGDENTLNIAKRNAYVQYLRNWNAIRQQSRTVSAR
jgi:hypothetical protein